MALVPSFCIPHHNLKILKIVSYHDKKPSDSGKKFFFNIYFRFSHSAIAHETKSPDPSMDNPILFLNSEG